MNRADILTMLPHAGRMCLLESVVEWDVDSMTCRGADYRNHAHPLARGGRLGAITLVEYGAQAAGLHAGLVARAGGRPTARAGVLAGIRRVTGLDEAIDARLAPVHIRARPRIASAAGLIYGFEVRHDDRLAVAGEITIIQHGV